MEISTKVDINFFEKEVRFLISRCSVNKKQSFYYKIDREKAKKMIDCLKHLEKMTWSQFSAIDRKLKGGLTREFIGSDSFKMIEEQDDSEDKIMGEKYYFHFRVDPNTKFRIFGFQKKEFFCITHIDPNGDIQHD